MADSTQVALAQFKQALSLRASDFKKLLPPHVSLDRFCATAQMAIAKDPKLLTYDQVSLFFAIREAARLGVEIGDRGMYLVPFKGKVVGIPSYKALVTLAKNAKDGPRIYAEVVREGDLIVIKRGTSPSIEHQPLYDGTERKVSLVYAVARFPDGTCDFEVMERWEIGAVMDMALGKMSNPDGSPWTTWPEEQSKKTVIKRLCKRLDIAPEMQDAVQRDNDFEAGKPVIMDVTAEVAEPTPQPTVTKVREALSKAATATEAKKTVGRQPGDDDDVPNFQEIP